ncbi:AAA family ATPase [Loktanella sp. TSTF-M6]|uniref:AAA family ATPase n=1 Tax=Loktanella gaetbuli TaxID=2881335 RepID=A0ABS8BWZ3_9RHOB|nr:AAA family ATPase [Loktanella gaetbuli]MCB5200225.1 AAA family ATPase [Loktanella gaetbuli]
MPLPPDSFTSQLMRDLLSRIHVHDTADGLPATTSGDWDDHEPARFSRQSDGAASATRELEPSQIAAILDAASDPDALAHGIDAKRRSPQIPLRKLLLGARLAACFDAPEQLAELFAPQAVNCLQVPDPAQRKQVWRDLPAIIRQLGYLAGQTVDPATVKIVVLGHRGTTRADHARATTDFADSMAQAIEDGKTIVALVPSVSALPSEVHPLVSRSLILPPASGAMLLAILRQTRACAGGLEDDALRDLMPDDAVLATMPLTQIQHAFHRPLARDILLRLRALAAPAPGTTSVCPLTLNRLYLPPEASAFCRDLLADLDSWRSGTASWSQVPSSACLVGPPGNGKTSLAAALAGSAGIPLITTSYADCQRAGHQGDFLRALSDKVAEAVSTAPCVMMIDELDSFSRRDRPGRSSDYILGVVNGLLEHLSVLNNSPGVVLIGATNHPDLVDPAVLRPGRFDRRIHLGNPDRAGIFRILQIELGPDAVVADALSVADRLIGASGAQVSAVVRDARAIARRAGSTLQPEHLTSAVDRTAPPQAADNARRIAIHEAGHAVVGHALGLPPPHRLRMTATGGTYEYPTPSIMTTQAAEAHLAVLLGGRAAELELLGSCSNGAETDLTQATRLAIDMRYNWGMRSSGTLALTDLTILGLTSSGEAMDLLTADLRNAEEVARSLVNTNSALVSRVADALMEARELDAEALGLLLNMDR